MRICAFLLLACWNAICAASALEGYGKLPLAFEENRGQTDRQVAFLARGAGFHLFLTPNAAVYRLRGESGSNVVRMELVGANRAASVRGIDRLPGESHYLASANPDEWIRHVAHYGRVEMREIYRGIDLLYYANASQLEYDFIVSPGADPASIAIDITGARKLAIDGEGRLVVETPSGNFVWRAPSVYQEIKGSRRAVRARYVLREGNRVGFRIARYDRRNALVIDPVLAYSTLIGGTGHDEARAIAVDASGSAVITGRAGANDFPTTPGAYNTAGGEVFVAKLNASGSALVYSTFLGTGIGKGIALQGGNVYVTGLALGSFPATAGAFNDGVPGQNVFVAKLAADGSSLVYSALFGAGLSQGAAIAVDAAGNAYVTGTTTASSFPTTANAFQATRANPLFAPDIDAFFVKLNASGTTLLYATYLGSGKVDEGASIAVDSSGDAYVAGTTEGRSADWQGESFAVPPFPTTSSAYKTSFVGTLSAFVTKFDPTASGAASVVYSTLLGADFQRDRANAVAIDGAGNAYVTGSGEAAYPLTAGAYGATSSLGGAFITKLDAAGASLVYSAMIPRTWGLGIALDSSNNAFVTGSVLQGATIAEVDPVAGMVRTDRFLVKLNAAGTNVHYSTYIQGYDSGFAAVAVDSTGAAYVAGDAFQHFNATAGAYQATFASAARDAFVSKFTTNHAPIANAGSNQTANVNFNSFTLDGTASSDPDGDPLTFTWRDAANAIVGTSAQVTLTRPQGIHVFTLTVDDGKLSASATVTVTINATLSMNFYGSATGRVTSSDGKVNCATLDFCPLADYPIPTPVTLTATSDTGAVFYGWVNGCSGTGTCTVTVNNNVIVGARFDVQQLTLSVNNGVGGKVTSIVGIDCGNACSVVLPYNSVATLQTTVDAGYLFDGWSGACSGSASTCTVTLDASKSVTASYRPIGLTSLAVAPASVTLAVGGQRQFTATASFSDGTTRALTDRSLESSDVHICAITRSGLVKCVSYQNPTVTPIPAYEKAIALAGGTNHMCALFANGTVNCEGIAVPLSGAAVAIASQTVTACALLANGTVQCWQGPSQTPAPVTISGVSNAVAIGAEAGGSTCVVIAGGSVSCWPGIAPAVPVPGVLNATSVTFGVVHGCAVISDGTVMCWGDNDHGQLGNGQFVTQGIYTPPSWVRDSAGVLTGAISVVSGDYHACALLSSGAVKCWGAAVGINRSTDSALAIPFFTQVPSGMAAIPVATAVAAGAFNVCVTIVDGTVWCQGTGPSPGLASGMQYAPPTLMAGFDSILSLSWSTANPGVASAMTNGVAVGRGAGSTLLTATEGSSSASTSITVSPGANVTTRAVSPNVSAPPVTVTFSAITQAGSTTLTSAPCSPLPPNGFQLGNPPQCFELATTATFSPPATVCFTYDPSAFTGPPDLFHFEAGAWKKITTTLNTVEHIICGDVSFFSPFALFAKASNPCADDRTAPSISRIAAAPNVLWPANGKMVPVVVSATVTDACDRAPRCKIVAVSSNEPAGDDSEGGDDGNFQGENNKPNAPDWEITGDMTLKLRAARSNKGNGRIYTITIRCADAAGNSSTRTVTVTVPRHK